MYLTGTRVHLVIPMESPGVETDRPHTQRTPCKLSPWNPRKGIETPTHGAGKPSAPRYPHGIPERGLKRHPVVRIGDFDFVIPMESPKGD